MMTLRGTCGTLLVVLGLSSLTLAGAAEPPKAAFTDPQKAGPDYRIQGEYLGQVNGEPYGLQVIALGNGQFQTVAYPQGLPGAGAIAFDRTSGKGATQDGVIQFVSDDGQVTATLQDGGLVIQQKDKKKIGQLAKIDRQSPTLGAKPPEGAVVLFDGKNADAFEKTGMSDDGLLKEGGISKRKFQSFQLHLEFRTPFMPNARGQERGNSGVYLQGRYELQVLDSFGLEGKDNECGGFYQLARPKVNMCLPPLAWQTYDIDFTAAQFDGQGNQTAPAKVTVEHNGVAIHKDLELPQATPGGVTDKASPEPGPLFLQNHTNPVRFRNIWIVEKK